MRGVNRKKGCVSQFGGATGSRACPGEEGEHCGFSTPRLKAAAGGEGDGVGQRRRKSGEREEPGGGDLHEQRGEKNGALKSPFAPHPSDSPPPLCDCSERFHDAW